MYGARGISVCERWQKSFAQFWADLGPRPTPRHTLERINNAGNYEPGNVRWATAKEQSRNTRRNHFLEHNGRRATIAEWAEATGISYANIKNRINNLGWTVAKALTTPPLNYGQTR